MSRTFEVVKAAPPAYVTAATVFGLPLSTWAQVLAIVYTLLIILHQIRKNWIPWLVSKPWTRAQWWK